MTSSLPVKPETNQKSPFLSPGANKNEANEVPSVVVSKQEAHETGSDVIDQEDDNEPLPVEQKLMNHLLRNYERSVRPVKNASDTVHVRMGLTLTQIFDMVSN